ncbi:hypothetical protein BAE44_0000549, partial [Dichanthelium oligosanthes]
LLLRLATCLLLLLLLPRLPLASAASVVTHLPGFDDPLPFYMETGYVGMEETRTELLLLPGNGYLIGNPVTGPKFDQNYIIPAAHGFGIISDQLYEVLKNCKGDYVNPANKLCAEVLHTINNLISEIPQAHILYKLCTTYVLYLAYFWINDDATRDSLGIKEYDLTHFGMRLIGNDDTNIAILKREQLANGYDASKVFHIQKTSQAALSTISTSQQEVTVHLCTGMVRA